MEIQWRFFQSWKVMELFGHFACKVIYKYLGNLSEDFGKSDHHVGYFLLREVMEILLYGQGKSWNFKSDFQIGVGTLK